MKKEVPSAVQKDYKIYNLYYAFCVQLASY
jgi:hypothetical protein